MIRLAHRALELEPRLGFLAALAGDCHMRNVLWWGYSSDPQFDRKEAVRLLRLALSADADDPDTLAVASAITVFMVGDCESAIEMADRAAALNPNSFFSHGTSEAGFIRLQGCTRKRSGALNAPFASVR